jgi:hypothetical protein
VAASIAVLLFRLSIFEGWTFVGDSDRLNTVLAVRLFETNALRERGSVPTWTEDQFMGYSMAGLHWILPGFTPVPYLLALLPAVETYHAMVFVAAGLLTLAILAGYVALRPYSASPIPAAVGGLAYGLSSYATLRIVQLDLPFSLLIVTPLIILLLRRTSRATAAWSFLGLTVCWAWLVLLTFLQEVAYVAALGGAYTLYRAIRLRDPWILLVSGLSFAIGVAFGVPRVLTVGTDFQELARTSNNFDTTAVQAVRFFGDGLLGRYFAEQSQVLRGTINLHEGIQMLGSALAASAALAAGLLSRSPLMRVLAIGLVVTLTLPLSTYARPFYEYGLGRMQYPSRELRTVLFNVVLVGVPLWFLTRWLVLRGARSVAYVERPASDAPDLTPEAARDGPFFLGIVIATLAVIMIPEAHLLIYYAFLKIDFTHSRLCVAALLPLATLVTIFLNRFLPPTLSRRTLAWLAGGLAVGVALWLVREAADSSIVAAYGPIFDVRPRWMMVETVRVVSSIALALVALGVLAARPRTDRLTLVGGVLIAFLVLENVAASDFKLSGPHTRNQPTPFAAYAHMNAAPGQLRPPSAAERQTVRERLESDSYRMVTYQDRSHFTALIEPHVAVFWEVRLVEGYSTGIPRRIVALPWVESMYAPHNLDIHTIHPLSDMPWRLLGILNVKYLMVVDRSFWYNPAPGGVDPPVDPARFQLIENPEPVTPRAFFTARVSPAGPTPALLGDSGVRPPPKDLPLVDPVQQSVVEGLDERTFSTAGTIAPTFDEDRVTVRVDPSPEARFLVLNELYHPSWRGWVDGQPTTIYPTNVVMRGIVVPPGATTVDLRFVPFLISGYGLALFAVALALAGLAWWGLRRWS